MAAGRTGRSLLVAVGEGAVSLVVQTITSSKEVREGKERAVSLKVRSRLTKFRRETRYLHGIGKHATGSQRLKQGPLKPP